MFFKWRSGIKVRVKQIRRTINGDPLRIISDSVYELKKMPGYLFVKRTSTHLVFKRIAWKGSRKGRMTYLDYGEITVDLTSKSVEITFYIEGTIFALYILGCTIGGIFWDHGALLGTGLFSLVAAARYFIARETAGDIIETVMNGEKTIVPGDKFF